MCLRALAAARELRSTRSEHRHEKDNGICQLRGIRWRFAGEYRTAINTRRPTGRSRTTQAGDDPLLPAPSPFRLRWQQRSRLPTAPVAEQAPAPCIGDSGALASPIPIPHTGCRHWLHGERPEWGLIPSPLPIMPRQTTYRLNTWADAAISAPPERLKSL